MRILVIEGSPHKHGSSNTLAEAFMKGARKNGHEIAVFDAGHADIHPCIGCDRCGMAGECVFRDDNAKLRDEILACDMVVFVTPIYYFGMSAQIKAAIDRFYSYNGKLMSRHIGAALITAAADTGDWVMNPTVEHYRTICRYLNFQDVGMVLGEGCGNVEMTRSSGFVEKAREFGESL